MQWGEDPAFKSSDRLDRSHQGAVNRRAALEESVGVAQASLPMNLGALLTHISCPAQSCRRPLSRNDLCNLMHPAALKKVCSLASPAQQICLGLLIPNNRPLKAINNGGYVSPMLHLSIHSLQCVVFSRPAR